MDSKHRNTGFFGKLVQLIAKVNKNLRENGVRVTLDKTLWWIEVRIKALEGLRLRQYMERNRYTEEELAQQAQRDFGQDVPIFSVVTPLYNTPEPFLREMIESVQAQSYANWQLCLADGSDDEHAYVGTTCAEYADRDQRIVYRKLEKNLGISGNSNACLEMAEGDYIALLDHDDVLLPASLYELANAVVERGADFVYTDEAIFRSPDTKNILFIHFKTGFALDNLRANNYICHLTAFRRSLLDETGPFREGYEGSQDHDLFLRLTKVATNIVHIPRVLYLWRAHPKSTATDASVKSYAGESGKKAVLDSLTAAGIPARVENAQDTLTIYRCIYELTSTPKVSIVIPNCDHADDLRACLVSIQEKSTYRNFEVIVVENNSRDPETFAFYEWMTTTWDNVRLITWDGVFNWSAINNYAVREAVTGEMILLLNNDIEVITPEWLEEMLMYAQRQDVGCVGAMLYYPDDTIQHAGVTIYQLTGAPSHLFIGVRRGEIGYMGKLCYAQDLLAVTGACMLMRRSVWDEVGGCDERFRVAYNDIDLCMRIRKAGYLVVWTPYAELYHYESKTRGEEDKPEERARLNAELARFDQIWADELVEGDPYHSPSLNLQGNMLRPRKRGR